MSTAPRFKKFVKSITIANSGSGYYSGGQVFVPQDDSAYALQYFAEEYVYNSATVAPVTLNTLKLIIPVATSEINGDVLERATGTVTLATDSSVESVKITNGGDGYIVPPVPYLAGTPTEVLNTSAVDPERDAGIYENIPTFSLSGVGDGLLVSIVVDDKGAVTSIVPSGGDFYGEGESCVINPVDIGGRVDDSPISFRITHINGGTGARFTSEIDIVQKESEYYVEKLSPLIEHQIPEFIANEYPTLVKFLEKYYEFNESNTTEFGIGPDNILHTFVDRHNLSFKHNTEETTTDFLDRFFREYGKDFPVSMEASEEVLLKNIRDFYTAKGSAKAVESLFRIMYNEEVEVFVPNQYVLRPSDNVWKREYVIKAYENTSLSSDERYDPADLEGRLVTLHYYESSGSVTTRKSIDASVLQVKTLAYTFPKAYEITLDINPTFDITSVGTGATFSASVAGTVGTINNISTADPLRVAGTYTVTDLDYGTSGDGHGAVFQVDVDALGKPTIIATTYGDDFAVGETITILDSVLGGGGAADVTFDIATISLGKISNIEILTPGVQYGANPVLVVTPNEADTITTVALPTTRITDGRVTSVVFEDDVQGVGYDNPPEIRIASEETASFLSLRDEDGTDVTHRKVFPSRILKAAVPWTTSGAPDGGFKVGQVFPVEETASLAVYAIDYFAEDYTLTGLSNNAFIRISQVNENNYPTTFEVVAVGIGFQNSVFLAPLVSNTGETATIVGITGFNAVYPGIFESTSGFLSDANKLHDNKIYQAFSYQVRSERPKSEWGDYVNRAAHPSGMIAFSDLQIRNTINFAATASIDTDLFFFVIMPDIEEVITSEFVAKDMHLPAISDSFDVQDAINSKDVTTPKYDTYDANDTVDKFDVTTSKYDTFSVSDVRNKTDIEKNLTVASAGTYAIDYFAEDYTFSADEGADLFHASDVINAFNLTTSYSDSVQFEDAIDNKEINLDGVSDIAEFDDTDRTFVYEKFLNIVIYGEYAIDYFAEDYTDVLSFESIANNEGEFVRVADSISLGYEPQPIFDTFETSDNAILVLIINRTPTDTVATSDSINLIDIYLSKAEIVSATELLTYDVGKINVDTMLTSDVNDKAIGTYHLDVPVFDDNVIKLPAINKTESTDFSENGTVTSQDFGEVDYFLEDYVANEVRYIV